MGTGLVSLDVLGLSLGVLGTSLGVLRLSLDAQGLSLDVPGPNLVVPVPILGVLTLNLDALDPPETCENLEKPKENQCFCKFG